MSESIHVPSVPIRVVTATSLFDGHDAAINIMRRILQAQGAEVIHLGHNRSVDDVVEAVICEDADAVAVSSYQGGHVEYFTYLVDRLGERGYGHVRVYGGGGGVIVAEEIEVLAARGVRIFSPGDGQRLGLAVMVNTIVRESDPPAGRGVDVDAVLAGDHAAVARALTAVERGAPSDDRLVAAAEAATVPVLGVTGTGGSGKSSLTDELLLRLRLDQEDKLAVAVLAVDPNRRRSGGALLGDRIRMNALGSGRVFFRSVGTRGADTELPAALGAMVGVCRAAGFDLVIVETPGIGQGDAAIVELADVSLYVMTPEFGAATQLEKIDMLDFADAVAINKFERRGAPDARRDVRRQLARNRELFDVDPEDLPVFGTVAARFNDDGVTALYQFLRGRLAGCGLAVGEGTLAPVSGREPSQLTTVVPPARVRYLAEVAEAVRAHHAATATQVDRVRALDQLTGARDQLAAAGSPTTDLDALIPTVAAQVGPEVESELAALRGARDQRSSWETLSGTVVPRVGLPRFADRAELVRFVREENLPGRFPFTAGVFAGRRDDEDPTRMFAGEGGPARTNARFHLLAAGQRATRLSTAFDSVTLYGADPDERPDIYGKVGTSGVSVATLDDMKVLYDGFDLCDPSTSVSMTINGPAPTILAMYLNTAIDQHPELTPAEVLSRVRGTVQADILKEDQGQNTCIFSTAFALRMMGDIQEWFIDHDVRRFYSVSISGYHIAEAGANPISQLAFTLANGFTYVEAYLARGMAIDDFAPNLSFFFSNGMDAEYTVLGRVARRIWAVAMRDRYGANERSQKLKYHIQTSGRSLHAQEMSFNDIRTTLQALCAIYDNANSLHTNAYDEAVTTPTDESVRRAMAIQLVINREWGLARTDNPLQGSYVVDELTDLVEAAGAGRARGHQRARRGDGRHGDRLPAGPHPGRVDALRAGQARRVAAHRGGEHLPEPGRRHRRTPVIELRRSDDAEKQDQLDRLRRFQAAHADERPAVLEDLRHTALTGHNTFASLMTAVRHASLGEITSALFEVGGRYRRNV